MSYNVPISGFYRCPLCKAKLEIIKYQQCDIYRCLYGNKNLVINGHHSYVFHYELLIFKDKTIGTNFIIDPFWVVSDEEYTNLYFIEENQATDLGYRESPLILLEDNLDEIKKKIKMFSLFS